MFVNQFESAVQADGVKETADGYVEIQHGQQYAVRLTNHWPVRANARLVIDGEECGTFRLAPRASIVVERPVHDTGHFTAYLTQSDEARQAGIVRGNSLNGVVQAIFTPEKQDSYDVWNLEQEIYYQPKVANNRTMSGEYAGVGTGLSGQSDQSFVSAGSMELDFSQMTTITLRLVARKAVPVHPLRPRPLRRNRVPSPVE